MSYNYGFPNGVKTFILPCDWLMYLWYGKGDNLNDEDKRNIADFLSDHNLDGVVDYDDEESFTKFHDALEYGWQACNCEEMTFSLKECNE